MRFRRGTKDDGLQADVGLIRQQLDALLSICEEAGVRVESAAADGVQGVPPALIMSSRARSSAPEPVLLTGTDGLQAIAVVGGSGDPAMWWDSVRRAVPPARGNATGLRHAHLADGLHAVAVPGASAATITVSSALDPQDRRAAVRTAVRAARRAGWLPSRVPAFLFPLLPLLAWRPAAKLVTAKAAAVAMTGTAVVAGGAATFVFATGHLGGSYRSPATDYDGHPAVVVPQGAGRLGVQPYQPRHSAPRYPLILRPLPSITAPGTHPPAAQGSGSPSPQPTPTTTSASPSPSPSPTATSAAPGPAPSQTAGGCLEILGVKVCLPV